jgi:Group II intron, maturase-specific domain
MDCGKALTDRGSFRLLDCWRLPHSPPRHPRAVRHNVALNDALHPRHLAVNGESQPQHHHRVARCAVCQQLAGQCRLCQHSKLEAQQLKTGMAEWLERHLGLTQHPLKTRITHWDRRFRFLGYDLRGQRNPNGTRWLRLSIPPEKERDVKEKIKRSCSYTQIPELDLFLNVDAQVRGWSQYFRYANNATQRFNYLTGVVYWLTAHYLGRKHRRSIRQVMRTHYGVDPISGKKALYVTGSGGKRVFIWNKPPQRCSVLSKVVKAKDIQPLPLMSWAQGRSYEQRQVQHAAKGQKCQHCGRTCTKLVVHHPNRLGRKAKRKSGPANVIASGQEQHAKLLCLECHQRHHREGW